MGVDELGENTPPGVAQKIRPLLMSQLYKSQGQMLLGDNSVDQVNDAEFDEQITSHLKASAGITIGQPQTSISRPSQLAAPAAGAVGLNKPKNRPAPVPQR